MGVDLGPLGGRSRGSKAWLRAARSCVTAECLLIPSGSSATRTLGGNGVLSAYHRVVGPPDTALVASRHYRAWLPEHGPICPALNLGFMRIDTCTGTRACINCTFERVHRPPHRWAA